MTRELARGNKTLAASAAGHVIAAGVLQWLLAQVLQETLQLSALYPLKTTMGFGIGALLFAPLLLRGHPHSSFGAANRVTLLRGTLVVLLGGFVGETIVPSAALAIVAGGLIALILDGVDGYLARHSGLASEFGARFDMETDAALILLFALLAWQMDKAGVWIVLSGLLRYLFVAAGWLLPWMCAPLPASKRRQTICVIQIAVMLAVLTPMASSPWSDALAALALAVLIASFLIDVRWLARNEIRPVQAGERQQ